MTVTTRRVALPTGAPGVVILDEACRICGSVRWCQRACINAPVAKAPSATLPAPKAAPKRRAPRPRKPKGERA